MELGKMAKLKGASVLINHQLQEIERLKALIKIAYEEGYGDGFSNEYDRIWENSQAKKELEK